MLMKKKIITPTYNHFTFLQERQQFADTAKKQ